MPWEKAGIAVLRIGCMTLSSSCILAPLSGISDLPFRMINRRFGCELAFTEMISSNAVVYKSKNTMAMLSTAPGDRPLGMQMLGNDPELIKKALDEINKLCFDVIDFNAACPAGRVTAKGKGAYLLREPLKLRELLKTVVRNSSAPVTAKIRTGWDDTSINARDTALHAEDAGINGLFIHGRTRMQGYSGEVDYSAIREVKKALKIPVIASGDALSPRLIKKMFDETGCDGVLIARGSLGNPWIFRKTHDYLKTGCDAPGPQVNEITAAMKSHLDSCCNFHGETKGVMIFRKFFGWYTKGISGIRPLRERAFHANAMEEMAEIISEISKSRHANALMIEQT